MSELFGEIMRKKIFEKYIFRNVYSDTIYSSIDEHWVDYVHVSIKIFNDLIIIAEEIRYKIFWDIE